MAESLRKYVNQSLSLLHHPQITNSISQMGNDCLNKSFEIDSTSDISDDSQEVLKMEIKQLKRENTFLKAKIQQLKKGNIQIKPQFLKRQSLNCLNVLKKKLDPKSFTPQNSLNFILKQIQSVLKSLALLYKIQADSKQWAINDLTFNTSCQQQAREIKFHKQYKQKLQKKLQMIPLQRQQTRYKSMLDVFSDFYQMNVEEEKKIKQKIQTYIQKTIQISKKLIEKASSKVYEKSMRSSCIYSTQQHSMDLDKISPNITLNESLIFGQKKFKNLEKHELSYSTIDAQVANMD